MKSVLKNLRFKKMGKLFKNLDLTMTIKMIFLHCYMFSVFILCYWNIELTE